MPNPEYYLHLQARRFCQFKIVNIVEMGGVIGGESPRNSSPASKLERKMVEAMQQRALKGTSVKSFNSVIMKFPKIDESLRNCRTIFQQFGELNKGDFEPQHGLTPI